MTTNPAAAKREPLLQRLRRGRDALFDDSIDRHVVAAFIMVAISVFGAVAAFRGALAEQKSIALERRLALGQLEDISFRQQFLAEVLVRIGMKNVERALKEESFDLRQAYKAFSGEREQSTNWLDWHAAELMAQRNASRRFSAYLRDLVSKDMTVEQEVATASASQLRRLGILATVTKEKNVEPALTFEQLDKAIATAHEVGPRLAFIVLMFVFGLVCMTLAELNLGPPRTWWLLTAAGTVVALAAIVALLVVDPASILVVAALTAFLGGAAILAARNGLFAIRHDVGHTPHPEAPEPARVSFAHLAGHSTHDTWSRTIVLLITVSVFISAVFGWAYSLALKHTGEFALEAQKERAELVNRRTRLGAVAMGGAIDSSITLLTMRIRCATATQLHTLAIDRVIDFDANQLDQARKYRCDALKEMTKENPELVNTLDGNDLADSASSPAKRILDMVHDRENGPATLFARSDGLSEISAGWGKRASRLLAVLTVLAIALYLFGQAYTMGATVAGRWLVGTGSALLALSIAVGLYAWATPVAAAPEKLPENCTKAAGEAAQSHHADLSDPHHTVDYAAQKYAEGVAAQNAAAAAPGNAERSKSDHEAALAYSCAIAARPGFIPAFQNYQRVISRMDNPQRGDNYSSLNSRTKLDELRDAQLRELNAFVQTGMLRPSTLLGNFAFDSIVVALANNRPEALDEARLVLRHLTGEDTWWQRFYLQTFRPELWSDEEPSEEALDRLNLGLSQLATGDEKEMKAAEVTYDKALKEGKGSSSDLLASALTDLEILSAYCRNLHQDTSTCSSMKAAIDHVRPRLAANLASKDVPAQRPAVRDFTASITPYAAAWQARFDGYDPKRDRLTVAWFRDDSATPGSPLDPAAWQVRRALPDLYTVFSPANADTFPAADQSGLIKHTQTFIDASGQCLAPGRYTVELFLNGAAVDSLTTTIWQPELRSFRSRDLDLVWCIPTNWEPWSGDTTKHPWFEDRPMRGFVENTAGETSKFGGAIMSFYAPASMNLEKRRAYFLRRALRILLRKDQHDDKGNLQSSWTQDKEDHLAADIVSFEDLTDADCSNGKPLGVMAYRFLVSRSDKNIVHLALVDGHNPLKDVCTILKSVTNYF